MTDIDQSALDQLRGLTTETGGDLIDALIDVFAESSVSLLEHLDEALAAGAGTDAKRFAHTLKGAASTVGATAVTTCARTIEELAGRDQITEAAALVPVLRELLPATVTALRHTFRS